MRYSDVQGGWSGTGNINSNPSFVTTPVAGTNGWGSSDDNYGDLRISSGGSAVINAGINAGIPYDDADIDDNGNFAETLPRDLDFINARVVSTAVDMGAYERDGCSVDADCDDGLACNGNESCDTGNCVSGTVFIDCNNDGVDDRCNIANDDSSDCNNNGVPDECDSGGPFNAVLVSSVPQNNHTLWRD